MTASTLKLFEIMLPQRNSISGTGYGPPHIQLTAALVSIAGGMTKWEGFGQWIEKTTGKSIREMVWVYRIGCTKEDFAKIIAKVQTLFPDEAEIFSTEIGSATLTLNPKKV